MQEEKVWDPLIRLWHWSLATAVVSGWLLGRYMDFDTIQWHFYIGYLVLGLMGFRLIWGFFGPQPVRWSTLIRSSTELPGYLREVGKREPGGSKGHSPLGALASLGLILVVSAQATSGLFLESDDFFESALLNAYVDTALANRLNWWHHQLADIILILVILHLAALGFYLLWKKENLIRPMITGRKWVKSKNNPGLTNSDV